MDLLILTKNQQQYFQKEKVCICAPGLFSICRALCQSAPPRPVWGEGRPLPPPGHHHHYHHHHLIVIIAIIIITITT